MVLPYLEAFKAKESGEISWEEYVHHIFARWAGIGHEEDTHRGSKNFAIRRADPFAYGVWCSTLALPTLTDTSQVEAVFNAYRRGTLDDVKNKYASLREPQDEYEPWQSSLATAVRKSLAFLALQERRPEVLQFCFDQGSFAFEVAFCEEAESVDPEKDLEVSRVLEESKYRKLYPKGTFAQGQKSDHPAATFDIGGKFPVEW